jgi:hypothetical protein
MDLLHTKLLRRVFRRISQCYCWRKTFEDNLSRCVKLFRETGGVYRRKTTGQPLKRTAAVSAVIETAREIMQNAPHTSVRQLSQRNRLNLM